MSESALAAAHPHNTTGKRLGLNAQTEEVEKREKKGQKQEMEI